MDNRVERRDPAQRIGAEIEREHVTYAEGNVGREALRQPHHLRREVNAHGLCAVIGQVARDLPWPTAHVGDDAQSARQLDEAIQQGAIQRLGGQLVEEARRILLGDGVISRLRRRFELLIHVACLPCMRRAGRPKTTRPMIAVPYAAAACGERL